MRAYLADLALEQILQVVGEGCEELLVVLFSPFHVGHILVAEAQPLLGHRLHPARGKERVAVGTAR